MSFKARDGIDVNAGKFIVTSDGDVTGRQINQIVNVKAFGAVGDSVTDDANAVALAAEFCVENGGILFFPRGDYHHPTYQIPDTIARLYETGDFIQSNQSFLKLGRKKPLTNVKEGSVYYDDVEKSIMMWNGTAWIRFLRQNGSDTIEGDLTIEGNLIVQGDTVTINTATLEVEDNIVLLNKNVTGTPTLNAGIEVERGTSNNAKIVFDESDDSWKLDNGLNILSKIQTGTDIISVKDFGAKGDGTTDDLAAINAAIAYAQTKITTNAIPTLYFPYSEGYNVSGSVAVPDKISVIMESAVKYTGTGNITVLKIGTEGGQTRAGVYKLMATRSTVSDWSNENSIAVQVNNVYESLIHVLMANYCTIGLQAMGSGTGNVYNTYVLGQLISNKIGLDICSQTYNSAIGWSNENVFIGGRFAAFSSGSTNGKTRYGVRMWSKDGTYTNNNNNLLLKPSFELHQSAATPGEALPVLIIDGTHNEIIGARNESNGPIFARITGSNKDVGKYNIIDVGYGDCVIDDQSVVKLNVGTSRKDKSMYNTYKMETVFRSESNLSEKVTEYQSNQFWVPGFSIINSTSGAITPSSTVIPISGKYVQVGSGRAIGFYVDTSVVKKFVLRRIRKSDGAQGRYYAKLYDSNGTLITGTNLSGNSNHITENGLSVPYYNATAWGGAYQEGSDNPSDLTVFRVGDTVSKIFLAFSGDINHVELRAETYCDAWVDYSYTPGKGLAITEPSKGIYKKGRVIDQADPVAGGSMGWVCTTGGAASKTAWTATTAYTVGSQVNANNKVYECTVAGTSGSTAPSHSTGTAVDGTVTWKYVDVLAVFKEFGLISE